MRKLIWLIAVVAATLSGCGKQDNAVSLGTMAMGEPSKPIVSFIKLHADEIEYEDSWNDKYALVADGTFPVLDAEWSKISVTFRNDSLVKVVLWKSFSDVPSGYTEHLDEVFSKYFKGSYAKAGEIKMFSDDESRYGAAYMIKYDDDEPWKATFAVAVKDNDEN